MCNRVTQRPVSAERCVLAVRVSTIRSVRSERFLPGSARARGILPHCTRVDDDNTDATQMPGGPGQRQCGLSAQLDVTFHVSTPPDRPSSASLRPLCSSCQSRICRDPLLRKVTTFRCDHLPLECWRHRSLPRSISTAGDDSRVSPRRSERALESGTNRDGHEPTYTQPRVQRRSDPS